MVLSCLEKKGEPSKGAEIKKKFNQRQTPKNKKT